MAKYQLTDTFSRTVVDGWGTSDSGHIWSEVPGSEAGAADVNGGRGTFSVATASAFATQRTDFGSSAIKGLCKWAISEAWTGNLNRLSVVVRADSGGGSGYNFRLENGTSNRVTLEIITLTSQVTIVDPYTYPDVYYLRFDATDILAAKAWKVGTPEPTNWQVIAPNPGTLNDTYVHIGESRFSDNQVTMYVEDIDFQYEPPSLSIVQSALSW